MSPAFIFLLSRNATTILAYGIQYLNSFVEVLSELAETSTRPGARGGAGVRARAASGSSVSTRWQHHVAEATSPPVPAVQPALIHTAFVWLIWALPTSPNVAQA